MSGCQNCSCGNGDVKEEEKVCPPVSTKIMIGEDGKCPCGKTPDECCHKEELQRDSAGAIDELCAPRKDKQIC